jgi:FtsP/CotA-like multicopper oxidase with cupredoxin domain
MHLHGFYYRVNSRGDAMRDSLFGPRDQRTVVTEVMKPFTTMSIAFEPDRPGNWLFHCHIAFHVLSSARLGPSEHGDHASGDVGRHMAGLVLGLAVKPARSWTPSPREDTRAMRLLVQEGARRSRAKRALGFVLQSGADPPAPDSVTLPGSLLVLTRDEPTDITVVNRLPEPTAVHWHGIELESYSDGVVGFSGEGSRLAPMIAPGDSFTARLTLPRSGTFIYHTHLNDLEQITSGLYGAIVVIERGARFDPDADRVFVAGWDGDGEPPHLVINGDSVPPPVDLVRGKPYRLRFVNIGPAASFRALLTRGADTVAWRPLAKDGFDMPGHTSIERKAVLVLDVGETADFEFMPARAGEYALTFAHAPVLPAVVQRFRVR